ncbi:MAG TPA: hypothetical protein VIK81_00025 [Patescibacteria group bacterium]
MEIYQKIVRFKIYLALFLILVLAAFLRFYQLGSLPPGLYVDEASQSYNAYSFALTGKDEYGKSLPLFLRSFGTYSSSLYAYLSAIIIKFAGLSVFTSRFLSAATGVAIVLVTFLLIAKSNLQNSLAKAVLVSLVVAVSPWAIFLSRGVYEPNLGLALLILGLVFLCASLKNNRLFIAGALILGLSTYAYNSERLVAPLTLLIFAILFRKTLLKDKRTAAIGFLFFLISQLPLIFLLGSAGPVVRLSGQSYFGQTFQVEYSNNWILNFALKSYALIKEFSSQYFAYFSPRNLFFDPDPDPQRSIPQLSVFYSWMIIPFVIGIYHLKQNFSLKKQGDPLIKLLFFVMLIALIPAALTKDPFSTFRALPLFWIFSIIAGLGIYQMLVHFRQRTFKVLVLAVLLLISLSSFWSSYFVLLKYERGKAWNYGFDELAVKTQENKNRQFIIDSSREAPAYILFAFYNKYDPAKLQKDYGWRATGNYYDSPNFDKSYQLDNVSVRPIVWETDIYLDQILVGDILAISDEQAKEHKLELFFEIKDPKGEILQRAFATNPKQKCQTLKPEFQTSEICRLILGL